MKSILDEIKLAYGLFFKGAFRLWINVNPKVRFQFTNIPVMNIICDNGA